MISRVQPALWKFEFNLLTSPMRSQTKQVDKTGKNKSPHTFGRGTKRRGKRISPWKTLLKSQYLFFFFFKVPFYVCITLEITWAKKSCKVVPKNANRKMGFYPVLICHHTNLFGIFWNVVLINHYITKFMISSILVLYLAT